MAADYWSSTQKKHWLFQPYELRDHRDAIEKQNSKLIEQYPIPDRRLIFIFIKDRLVQLSKRLQFRQQSVATAMVYLHRYFLFNAIQSVNLYQMVATAFYLASKTDESPHHIRLVASEARQAWPEYVPGDVSRLGELEFCLISEMHSQLIVWHPYRSLMALKENQKLALTQEELSLAWSIINDTFMTDLPLTCPPYMIAITAMFLATIFTPGKLSADLNASTSDTTMADVSRFASLGGRPGLSTTFNQAMNAMPPPPSPQSSAPSKPNKQAARNQALAAAASSDKLQNVIRFLIESEINVQHMIDITQEIISLYEIWETYSEKSIKDAIARGIRGQRLEG